MRVALVRNSSLSRNVGISSALQSRPNIASLPAAIISQPSAVLNASYGAELRPVLEVTLAEWQMEIDDSVTTTFVACQAVGQRMIGRGAGRIINVVAIAHDRAVPNSTLFSASQAAVIGLTRALGVEWGRGGGVQGVMVNALGLGFYEETEGPNELAVDVQAALVYLATESTDDVQGEMLMVDGAFAEPGE